MNAIVQKLVSIILIIPSLLGLYITDSKDTEEAFAEKVSEVGYENTMETAVPQTEIYTMIKEHFNSPLPEGKTEKKAILIGYDGCRADVLTQVKDSRSGINKLLDDGGSIRLAYCGGVNYPAPNIQDTSTAPGWCSMLTGQLADKTGITGNGIVKSLEYKTLLTTLVEDGIIDSSNFITRWKGHFVNDDGTYVEEKAYCEEQGLNVGFTYKINNDACAIAAIEDIKQDDCSDFIFAIYEGTDSNGHNFGFSINNPLYRLGFSANELRAYNTICAIENRDTYETEDWLIIISSDHGGYGKGHGGPTLQERMVFIVTNK